MLTFPLSPERNVVDIPDQNNIRYPKKPAHVRENHSRSPTSGPFLPHLNGAHGVSLALQSDLFGDPPPFFSAARLSSCVGYHKLVLGFVPGASSLASRVHILSISFCKAVCGQNSKWSIHALFMVARRSLPASAGSSRCRRAVAYRIRVVFSADKCSARLLPS